MTNVRRMAKLGRRCGRVRGQLTERGGGWVCLFEPTRLRRIALLPCCLKTSSGRRRPPLSLSHRNVPPGCEIPIAVKHKTRQRRPKYYYGACSPRANDKLLPAFELQHNSSFKPAKNIGIVQGASGGLRPPWAQCLKIWHLGLRKDAWKLFERPAAG